MGDKEGRISVLRSFLVTTGTARLNTRSCTGNGLFMKSGVKLH